MARILIPDFFKCVGLVGKKGNLLHKCLSCSAVSKPFSCCYTSRVNLKKYIEVRVIHYMLILLLYFSL